jgi:hypothetical protein
MHRSDTLKDERQTGDPTGRLKFFAAPDPRPRGRLCDEAKPTKQSSIDGGLWIASLRSQ